MADEVEVVDKGRVGGAPVADWRRLYDVAARIHALNPWEWMSLGHLFGVQPYGAHEPSFILFSELAESSQRIVALFPGWRAFRIAFANNANTDDRPPLEKAVEESWRRLLYVPYKGLRRTHRAVLKRLGLLTEDGVNFPVFYSQHVGYYPDRLSATEVVEMQEILYQAYGMAMRVESEPTLTQQRLPKTFFVRMQDANGLWRDTWVDEPPLTDEGVDVSIDLGRVRRIAEFTRVRNVLQVDLVLTSLRAKSRGNHRSEAVFTLLLMNRTDKSVICCEALQALQGVDVMWSRVPGIVLRELEQFGALPDEIEVRSERMLNILRPLSEMLPFTLRRREKLMTLEGVSASLAELL